MSYPRIDGRRVKVAPLAARDSKHHIDEIRVDPDGPLTPATPRQTAQIEEIANRIRIARSRDATVMLAYGAHLVKNGLAPVVTHMMENGWITHLATNGAGVIHDWEYAFHGQSEEDVRAHVARGCFGTWDETGRHTAPGGARRFGGRSWLRGIGGPDDRRGRVPYSRSVRTPKGALGLVRPSRG